MAWVWNHYIIICAAIWYCQSVSIICKLSIQIYCSHFYVFTLHVPEICILLDSLTSLMDFCWSKINCVTVWCFFLPASIRFACGREESSPTNHVEEYFYGCGVPFLRLCGINEEKMHLENVDFHFADFRSHHKFSNENLDNLNNMAMSIVEKNFFFIVSTAKKRTPTLKWKTGNFIRKPPKKNPSLEYKTDTT